ncbi:MULTISPECIES: hypothetical protein [unclassified Streptomyces]|uniref:hypothetical protein n=1 Tax=unclassified Streptomyces TaxID=2593676 RepID=UPI0033CE0DDC
MCAHTRRAESYDAPHERFCAQIPWFSCTRFNGETRFPDVEPSQEVAADIEDFLETK